MSESDLISEVIELDRQAHRLIRRHSFNAWMELNLTNPQLKTLFFISDQPGANPGKLAAALGVTPSNVTGIVDRLVEQGLLSRQENPEDRRVLMLQTTEKGEAILSDLRERRTGTMRDILAHLSVEELSYLVKGLSALVRAAQAHEEESRDEYDRGQKPDQEVRPLHSGG
jgi:DNA-binding MarR family transcriptional regulator